MTTTKANLESELKINASQCDELLKACGIALDLGDFSEHLERLKEIHANKGKGTYAEAVAKHTASSSAIAPTKDRPLPDLVSNQTRTVVPVDLSGIPVEGAVSKQWEEIAKKGAETDADQLAGAPFDGIIEGSELVGEQAEALKQHGFNLYMQEFGEAMKDPDLAKKVENRYLGKFPAHWNLKPKS